MATHIPVMVDTCLELLNLRPKGTIIDATLGLGGHGEAILADTDVTVIGIDRDEDAIAIASKRLGKFGKRFQAVHTTYDKIGEVAAEHGGVDGILMDLGVSSMQLDEVERGFAYSRSAPLDMRMDRSCGETAAQLLARVSAPELTQILKRYGQEPSARKLADAIVAERAEHPIQTSDQLNAIIDAAMPAPARRHGGHPAKRTFQALRIAVNGELSILARALPSALSALKPQGRLVVEAYQSLEDRLVKRAFADVTRDPNPVDLPIMQNQISLKYQLVTRGAVRASEAEIKANPRSASVRIRAIERTTI